MATHGAREVGNLLVWALLRAYLPSCLPASTCMRPTASRLLTRAGMRAKALSARSTISRSESMAASTSLGLARLSCTYRAEGIQRIVGS